MTERYVQTPDWAVFIGDWSVERLVQLDLVSSRLRPFTTLTMRLDNEEGRLDGAFETGAEISVGLGDRETGLRLVFHGELEEPQEGRVLVLKARDDMLRVARHTVTQSWLRVTPQDVARAVFEAAGIPYQLGEASVPRRHRVVSRGLSALALLQQMDREWGLGWDLYCEADGTVWWGPWVESPRYRAALNAELTVLAHGESLFELEPTDGDQVGRAETWLHADLRHSGLVGLADARFWRERRLARIERVTHRLGGKVQAAGGRTEIEWRLVG